MAATVNQYNPVTRFDQCRHLVRPIATVTQATVQQNNGGTLAMRCIPDARAVMVHRTDMLRLCNRGCPVCFEMIQFVVVRLHIDSSKTRHP